MPEPSSAPEPQPVQQPKPPAQAVPVDAGHIPITEELDSAKWRLPPLLPVVISGLALALIVGIFAWIFSRPLASGQILTVTSTEQVTKDSVLVGLNVAVKNVSKGPLYIKRIHAEMTPGSAKTQDQSVMNDDAASASDFDRYFQAYPTLAQNKMEPLRPETKLQPGESQQGMVIVSFPVNQQAFNELQSLRVVIDFYDHSVPAKIQ